MQRICNLSASICSAFFETTSAFLPAFHNLEAPTTHSFHNDLQNQLRTSCMFVHLPRHSSNSNHRQSRESIDSRRSPPPDELLSPLATLYPHVTALQPQYNPNSCTFTGYRHTGYWAAAYTTQPLEEPTLTRRPTGMLREFSISSQLATFAN